MVQYAGEWNNNLGDEWGSEWGMIADNQSLYYLTTGDVPEVWLIVRGRTASVNGQPLSVKFSLWDGTEYVEVATLTWSTTSYTAYSRIVSHILDTTTKIANTRLKVERVDAYNYAVRVTWAFLRIKNHAGDNDVSVISFSGDVSEWSKVGNSPYLHEGDADYITCTGAGKTDQYYSFDSISGIDFDPQGAKLKKINVNTMTLEYEKSLTKHGPNSIIKQGNYLYILCEGQLGYNPLLLKVQDTGSTFTEIDSIALLTNYDYKTDGIKYKTTSELQIDSDDSTILWITTAVSTASYDETVIFQKVNLSTFTIVDTQTYTSISGGGGYISQILQYNGYFYLKARNKRLFKVLKTNLASFSYTDTNLWYSHRWAVLAGGKIWIADDYYLGEIDPSTLAIEYHDVDDIYGSGWNAYDSYMFQFAKGDNEFYASDDWGQTGKMRGSPYGAVWDEPFSLWEYYDQSYVIGIVGLQVGQLQFLFYADWAGSYPDKIVKVILEIPDNTVIFGDTTILTEQIIDFEAEQASDVFVPNWVRNEETIIRQAVSNPKLTSQYGLWYGQFGFTTNNPHSKPTCWGHDLGGSWNTYIVSYNAPTGGLAYFRSGTVTSATFWARMNTTTRIMHVEITYTDDSTEHDTFVIDYNDVWQQFDFTYMFQLHPEKYIKKIDWHTDLVWSKAIDDVYIFYVDEGKRDVDETIWSKKKDVLKYTLRLTDEQLQELKTQANSHTLMAFYDTIYGYTGSVWIDAIESDFDSVDAEYPWKVVLTLVTVS